MALTRAQFVTELSDVIGKSSSALARSGAVLSDRAVTWLNFGQMRIARYYNFHELNATVTPSLVVDTKSYPMITGTNNFGMTRPKDIETVTITTAGQAIKLERKHPRWLEQRYPRPEDYASARPIIYTRWNYNLDFFPIPNDTYTLRIRYMQWPSELSSSSQTSDFIMKDGLVLTAGILEAYLALEEYNNAKIYYELFKGQLIDAVKAEGDVDWSPDAEHFGNLRQISGEYWLDPYGTPGDPLYGYPG